MPVPFLVKCIMLVFYCYCNKLPQTEWLNAQKIIQFGKIGSESKVSAEPHSRQSLQEKSLSCLFQLLELQSTPSEPWLCGNIISASVSSGLLLCVDFCMSTPFLIRNSSYLEPTLSQDNFILTDYTCKVLISK